MAKKPIGRSGRTCCLSGPLAIALAWAVIGLSWLLNREWFVFTRDAFSDFGGSQSCCPGLYNYGLITVGIIVVVFSMCLVRFSVNKLEVGGAFYLALAGVFLALIGVYPSGTRPHTFVSTWFFVQADIALILSIGGLFMRRRKPGDGALLAGMLAGFPVALLVEAIIGWPSAAAIEAFGVIVIDAGVLWLAGACLKGD